MEKPANPLFVTANAPQKDWFLQFLVNLANKNNFELDITLTVGGFLISGTVTGVRKYFDALGDYFAKPFNVSQSAEEVSGTFKKIGEQCSCVSPSEQTENPSYIHLKNAKFYDASGKSLSASAWWRGRISEVKGFSPGTME